MGRRPAHTREEKEEEEEEREDAGVGTGHRTPDTGHRTPLTGAEGGLSSAPPQSQSCKPRRLEAPRGRAALTGLTLEMWACAAHSTAEAGVV